MKRGEREDWDRLQDRWAAGEPLSADDEKRRHAQATADPSARRELEMLEAMSGLLDRAQPDVADDPLIERVLERAGVAARQNVLYLRRRGAEPARSAAAVDAPTPAARRTRSISFVFGGAAAALAVVAAVYASVRSTAALEADAMLVSTSGEAQIESSSAWGAARSETAPVPGTRLRVGDHVRTGRGSACLKVQPAIEVCLGPDSDVEVGSLLPPETQILVGRGIAVAALAPRPAGQSFALVGGDVVAVAHGTVYALDRTSAVNVDVVVLEGTVAVHAAGRAGAPDLVPAHTRWRSQPAARTALQPSEPSEEAVFAALLAPAASDQPATSIVQTPARIRSLEQPTHPVPHGSVDSPDVCLSRARSALDRGDKSAALGWYRRLRERFPNDEAARTVLVTSGRLEMDLGASARALDDFQTYLRGGAGALDVEALAGAAHALRALGRVNDERRAIEGYLARFPNGFDAPLFRSRLAELEEPPRAHAIDSRR
jgi:hypothetical protein